MEMTNKDTILHIDRETLLQEYIPRTDYEARLKADMVAMLTDIQLRIEEVDISKGVVTQLGYMDYTPEYMQMVASDIIQQKINALRGEADESSNIHQNHS